MRLIVWGLPLHSHTHSYIHQAFSRAANYMNFETHWISNDLRSNDLLRKGDIVICCGVEDDKLLPKNGVNYVLHNSSRDDLRQESYINLQVYTHDVLKRETENWGDLTFWQKDNRTLYQPWATDLLPQEIEKIQPFYANRSLQDVIWVGSIMTGIHGNYDEILSYASFCEKNNINFKHVRGVSIEENISLLRKSRHSIAIQGKWQVENGYVPCRIFKNISYGCLTFTNSKVVSDLLNLPHFNNMEDMFFAAESHLLNPKKNELNDVIQTVKKNHTYINRLQNIIECIKNR